MFYTDTLRVNKAIQYKPITTIEVLGYVAKNISEGCKCKVGVSTKCFEYEVEVVWTNIDKEALYRKYHTITVKKMLDDIESGVSSGTIRVLTDEPLNILDNIFIPMGSTFYMSNKYIYCYKTYKSKSKWVYIANTDLIYKDAVVNRITMQQCAELCYRKNKTKDSIGELSILSATLLKSILHIGVNKPKLEYQIYLVDTLSVKQAIEKYSKLPAYRQEFQHYKNTLKGEGIDIIHAKSLAKVLGLEESFVTSDNTRLFLARNLWELNILLDSVLDDAWIRQLLLYFNDTAGIEYAKYQLVRKLKLQKVIRLLGCNLSVVSDLVRDGVVFKFIDKGVVWVGYKEFTV